MRKSPIKGIGLIEVIIASSIIAIGFVVIMQAYTIAVKNSFSNLKKIQAAMLLEEGEEAVRGMRDSSWTNKIKTLSSNTNYYLFFDNIFLSWTSTTTLSYIDGTYVRSFSLSDVYRDSQNNISSGGTLDQNAKKVTVSVSWQDNGTTTKSISTIFTNILNN